MKAMVSAVSLAAIGCFIAGTAMAQTTNHAQADHRTFTPQAITWSAGPPSLPRGAQAALLFGDPSKEGPFVLRLRFPDGYLVPPHRHGGAEILTVISGTFALGAGENASMGEVTRLTAGSFTAMPANMPHFARAEGDTVVQLNSIGPWTITYVNPGDDPRR
ncbi:cupin domain-containing protein [Roseomonas terrae]|uniref:Cupin domain-containing protein n=1 Tax=Neoroseomonas terrae TaxID=424799 RepID=A0ABS5EKC9_9PROT|nr:cupin domain-containing protein [Neoroseomonas terrae]MBR0651472.1 cupin domain-containing protein [Neoroseomonas terrae]